MEDQAKAAARHEQRGLQGKDDAKMKTIEKKLSGGWCFFSAAGTFILPNGLILWIVAVTLLVIHNTAPLDKREVPRRLESKLPSALRDFVRRDRSSSRQSNNKSSYASAEGSRSHENPKYGPWSLSPYHPIANMIVDPENYKFDMEYDGYSRVHRLNVCEVGRGGPASPSLPLFEEWQTLWHPRANIPTDPKVVADAFRFAIVQDPLERLYATFVNMCLHQEPHNRRRQHKFCPGFPQAWKEPPTFKEFLQRQYQSNWDIVEWHPHFRPMSRVCDLSSNKVDVVLSVASDSILGDLTTLWETLGLPPKFVENELQFSRGIMGIGVQGMALAVESVGEVFDCETLTLALPSVNKDYRGPYTEFFPFPEWAVKLLEQDCKVQRVSDEDFANVLHATTLLS